VGEPNEEVLAEKETSGFQGPLAFF
jgi:hypothetical protein